MSDEGASGASAVPKWHLPGPRGPAPRPLSHGTGFAPLRAGEYPHPRFRSPRKRRPSMIEAQSLTRRYGDFTAVQDISFSVGEGEIVGMLGPNGAGKTTTIRMITGFLPPTEG